MMTRSCFDGGVGGYGLSSCFQDRSCFFRRTKFVRFIKMGGDGMIPYRFGEKHKEYMRRALSCTMNVAEGAVRSGKTVDNVFVFAHLLETTADRLHLATGATGGTAKVTLGDCGGFGLEAIFRGRCRWHSYKGCDAD